MPRPLFPETIADGLLADHQVEDLLTQLTPIQKRFLSGLGRGLTPLEAAQRAGWQGDQADRIARAYMDGHPVVSRLAAHVLCLRELATLADDDTEPEVSGSIH
jgi:hypothetical protein